MKQGIINSILISFVLIFVNCAALGPADHYQVQQDGITVRVIPEPPWSSKVKFFKVHIFNDTLVPLDIPATVGFTGSIVASTEVIDAARQELHSLRTIIAILVGGPHGCVAGYGMALILTDTHLYGLIGGLAGLLGSSAFMYSIIWYMGHPLEKSIADYQKRTKVTLLPQSEQELTLLVDSTKLSQAINKHVIVQLRDEKNGKVIRIPLDIQAAIPVDKKQQQINDLIEQIDYFFENKK